MRRLRPDSPPYRIPHWKSAASVKLIVGAEGATTLGNSQAKGPLGVGTLESRQLVLSCLTEDVSREIQVELIGSDCW